jgi:hypothetical protein
MTTLSTLEEQAYSTLGALADKCLKKVADEKSAPALALSQLKAACKQGDGSQVNSLLSQLSSSLIKLGLNQHFAAMQNLAKALVRPATPPSPSAKENTEPTFNLVI